MFIKHRVASEEFFYLVITWVKFCDMSVILPKAKFINVVLKTLKWLSEYQNR